MIGLATLTALSWHGPLPAPGEYLKAPRGRTAFLVVKVVHPRKPCGYVARLRCERTSPGSMPTGARVHVWHWSGR